MRNIKRITETEIDVHLSACELAQVFWAMDAEEQCAFFDKLYHIAGHKMAMQLQAVIDNECFSLKAKIAMDMIGNYSQESSPKIKAYEDNKL